MKHEEMMEHEPEYKKTYDVLLKEKLSIDRIIEVVVKSNGLVGVGVISFKDDINKLLNDLMKGY